MRARRYTYRDVHISECDASERDHVAIAQIRLLDALSVDERAVGTAVVENPLAVRARDEDRVTTRDGTVVEMQVGADTASNVNDLLIERDAERLPRSLNLYVAT